MFVLQTLFPIICSMSLIGGIVIILVLLVRLPFRRLPKIFSYLLWSVVLLRLLCPFTFSSHLSVFQVIGTPLIQQNQNIDLGNTTNFDYLGNAQKPGESASLQEQENRAICYKTAAVESEVPLLSFAEASLQTQVLQFLKSKAGTLPGSDEGYWYSVMTDGVEYLYGKYDYDKEGSYQLFSWALRDASHKLANGLKVGITKEEALKLCPNLVRIEFDGEGVVRWNRTAYPQNWTDEFDYMLAVNIEDNIDNLPQVLALMIKGESVQAITIYAPTAG